MNVYDEKPGIHQLDAFKLIILRVIESFVHNSWDKAISLAKLTEAINKSPYIQYVRYQMDDNYPGIDCKSLITLKDVILSITRTFKSTDIHILKENKDSFTLTLSPADFQALINSFTTRYTENISSQIRKDEQDYKAKQTEIGLIEKGSMDKTIIEEFKATHSNQETSSKPDTNSVQNAQIIQSTIQKISSINQAPHLPVQSQEGQKVEVQQPQSQIPPKQNTLPDTNVSKEASITEPKVEQELKVPQEQSTKEVLDTKQVVQDSNNNQKVQTVEKTETESSQNNVPTDSEPQLQIQSQSNSENLTQPINTHQSPSKINIQLQIQQHIQQQELLAKSNQSSQVSVETPVIQQKQADSSLQLPQTTNNYSSDLEKTQTDNETQTSQAQDSKPSEEALPKESGTDSLEQPQQTEQTEIQTQTESLKEQVQETLAEKKEEPLVLESEDKPVELLESNKSDDHIVTEEQEPKQVKSDGQEEATKEDEEIVDSEEVVEEVVEEPVEKATENDTEESNETEESPEVEVQVKAEAKVKDDEEPDSAELEETPVLQDAEDENIETDELKKEQFKEEDHRDSTEEEELDNQETVETKKRPLEETKEEDEDLKKPKKKVKTEGRVPNKKLQVVSNPLIANISSYKYASTFLQPVNEAVAPEYYSLIKQPRDLKTIKQMVKDGRIQDKVELERDILLMYANAIMYNKSGTDIYDWAKEMQVETDKMLEMFKDTETD